MVLGSTHATKKLQSQSFLVFCIEFFWKAKLEGTFAGALWPPLLTKLLPLHLYGSYGLSFGPFRVDTHVRCLLSFDPIINFLFQPVINNLSIGC